VRGVVQGVGFRPFVYRLAQEEGSPALSATIPSGVTIEFEGTGRSHRILSSPPRSRSSTARAHRLCSGAAKSEPTAKAGFRIVASEACGRRSATGIPADAATCADCLRELLDPNDRRYRYPFLNCTNCGPRYTITRRIPYDRPQTSMARFTMCPACQAEYDDPTNRRFHAQPNACPVCGPPFASGSK
jgi:hydrogenase maturation protein HypF